MPLNLVGGRILVRNRESIKFDSLEGILGNKVSRASATLPQTGDDALFTITGGRVAVSLILGEVTVVIETQANNTLLKLNPTATGATQDICAALDISADAVGELYTISGVAADAMRSALLIGLGMTAPIILSEGDIELECSAGNDGEVAWDLWYTPIDSGAVIVAA